METTAAAIIEERKKSRMVVVGIDESDHSYQALKWTLDHLFSPSSAAASTFKLVVVYAKPSAASIIDFGSSDLLMESVESNLKKVAAWVVDRAKKLCLSRSVHDVLLEVVEGDARNVLCRSVERHHADMLVIGSHGYGTFMRVLLGSVSDYCVHHVPCTVMIVKNP